MADYLEQAKLDIAKAIYIGQITNAGKNGQTLSESEVARKAISDAEVFVQEWNKIKTTSNKPIPSTAFVANKGGM